MAITADIPDHVPLDGTALETDYESWLTRQVQEAIDDPRPSVPHNEVAAEWAIERAALLKQAKSMGN
jgi:hypothetical protein